MKVLVVNGSPKGENSITLHTCLYLKEHFPQIEWSFLDAGRKIKQLERDFSEALKALLEVNVVLFSYPVYTFMAPYQLHRFIELMKESGADFSSLTATQITTSKHFYDITAHRFIADNCQDMGIDFIDGLSADMEDILSPEGRRQALDWFGLFLWRYGEKDAEISPVKDASKKAVIVADLPEGQSALKGMIEAFKEQFPYECDVVNIREFPFMGGCISCFNCAGDGKCFYKDGFDTFLRENIHKHDAILYAFTVKDHSMGSRFKMYDDRQFCNGHRTVTMGIPFGYIIDGQLDNEPNLKLILEARAQVGGNFLAGFATNERDSAESIRLLAQTTAYAMEKKLCPPSNFLGVGGMKIFRDLIYMMRGMMRADHKFFKSHGQYDFPQKKWGKSMAMYLVGWMMRSKSLKAKMGSKINEGMIAPYKKAIKAKD